MLYYTAPSNECFEELKARAIQIWESYDAESPQYATEKVSRIFSITNVDDNFMYIFAMFDVNNQRRVVDGLSDATKDALRERLVDGGQPEFLIKNIGL